MTGPIQAISINNNFVTLPPDILDNLPVKIASFYYQNLSRWLPHDHPNQSIISSVLSSTNCTDCSITELTTPVNIVFNLSSQQVNKIYSVVTTTSSLLPLHRYQVLIIYLVYIGSLNCMYYYQDCTECSLSPIRSDITLPSGEWNTDGCGLISQEGSTVTCQCDHLTHFAILLSPGVPVCQSVCLSVYVYIYIYIYLYICVCPLNRLVTKIVRSFKL